MNEVVPTSRSFSKAAGCAELRKNNEDEAVYKMQKAKRRK